MTNKSSWWCGFSDFENVVKMVVKVRILMILMLHSWRNFGIWLKMR